jgi:hypothetical protein
MRALIGTIRVMGMVLATSAIQAQIYDLHYPVSRLHDLAEEQTRRSFLI